MRKIGEVLRLQAQGLSRREISQSVGAARSTVSEYLRRAAAGGIRWPLPEGLDESELEEKLFPPPMVAAGKSRPLPDWAEVHRELKSRRHVTLMLLWLEYRESHPEGLGYSQFCWQYRRWQGAQDVVMRLEYRGGERLFVDYSGDTVPVLDPETGEIRYAQIFVAALGASGLLYAEASWSQDLGSWLLAHVRCFEALGGVTEVVTPDNLRSGVSRACWFDPEINPSYLELARHYGTAILPTRIAKPRDKAAAEVGVQVVERWVLARLRHRRFFCLEELNLAMRELIEEVNGRAFRGQASSRRDLFLELEKGALRPLPANRYEFARWKRAKLGIDYHVECAGHFYSAPYRLARQEVEVRATSQVVEIYHKGARVASHVREYGKRRFVTDPKHMPASHRAHLEWTPSRLVRWGAEAGPAVAELAETMMRTRPHPEHGYRACLGLMQLEKRYGKERLNAACQRALLVRSPSYQSVKSILKVGLDRVPAAAPKLVVLAAGGHENLRGPAYYRQEA
ncbi:MAG: IS21 family transposase [Candidatus Dormibacteraeota bacterium]|nr:IS21 family transposase [Candidatus Dormibacteraeota bacterium]